jgi:TatD DNase family protein
MELIDTHCHLTFAELAGDVEGVIARSKAAGVTGWITVGTDRRQIKKVIALISGYDNMYAAIGIHPHYAKDASPEDIAFLKTAAKSDKVVGSWPSGKRASIITIPAPKPRHKRRYSEHSWKSLLSWLFRL